MTGRGTSKTSALAAIALAAASAVPALAQTETLKVASYNILHGASFGGQLNETRDVILASGADVVGIQEADGAADELAAMLGWHYRAFSFDRGSESGFTDNTDTAILSRFPITQTLRSGVRVEVASGKEAFVFGAHLPAYPYQPYDLRDGVISTEAQAIASAQATRGAQMNQILSEMSPYVAAGAPVFLTGDMNEPSHRDWTPAAASAGKHAIKVAWPASTATVNAGFADSYRQIYPNEVTHIGNTWTPSPGANEVHDRIDFVYSASNGIMTTNSQLVGESSANANIIVAPYPSDHRAVVSTFSIPNTTLAPVRAGVNLISNSGAEANPGAAGSADRILTDWETSANNNLATAQLYDKSGYPSSFSGSGWNHFYGGNVGITGGEVRSITQTIGVADLAGYIDSAAANFTISGHFGGYENQNDRASLTGTFLSDSGASVGSVTIGNVTAAERSNVTQLLFRSAGGTLPALTRDIRFTLGFTKFSGGTFNDGSADNLSFVITVPTPPTWVNANGGDWHAASNWNGNAVPDGVSAEARLFNAISAPCTVFADSLVTLGTLRFNSFSTYHLPGASTLTLDVNSGSALIDVQAGTHKINLPLTIASDTNVIVAAGAALKMSDPVTVSVGKTLTHSGAGSVSYESTVTVQAGGSIELADGSGTLSAGALAVADDARIDLRDNQLIVTGGDLGTFVGGEYTGISGLLQRGFNRGDWNGSGIVTSISDARTMLTTLAVREREGEVHVMYTWGGDADMDGDLDGDDYFCIDSHVLHSGSVFGFHSGDFDYDGDIDGDDYFIIDSNISYAQTQPRFPTVAGAVDVVVMPEPAAIGLVVIGAAMLRRRRP